MLSNASSSQTEEKFAVNEIVTIFAENNAGLMRAAGQTHGVAIAISAGLAEAIIIPQNLRLSEVLGEIIGPKFHRRQETD